MEHKVAKPFHDEGKNRIVQPGEKVTVTDTTRVAELAAAGLIEKPKGHAESAPAAPPAKAEPAAPRNKDAGQQPRSKK